MYLLYFLPQLLFAQWSFRQLEIKQDFHSGIVASAADVNGDYVDDLLVLDQARELWLGINSGLDYFHWQSLGFISSHSCWSINVADFDNNGFADILIGGDAKGLHVLYQTNGEFKKTLISNSVFFSQSSALYDINQDGWVDATVCDDNNKMKLYANNGAGVLQNNESWINFSLPDPISNSGNYGCIWSDFDRDGDGDFYVAKCKAEVDDPNDGRRKNLFFVNDSQRFTEKGALYGINFGDQSWAAAFEDLNMDGLPDLFVLNHYTPSILLKQNGDHTFTDVTGISGLLYQGIPIQCCIADWDNDMDMDVLMVDTIVELWLNDGKMNFTKGILPFDQHIFNSMVYGDFNEDGFLDIYALYPELLNNPSKRKDLLWLHPGNNNHFFKLSLKATRSNNSCIGVQAEVYAGGNVMYRELKSGQSFGLEHSHTLHFGLGNASVVDSVIVLWPSGIKEKFYNLKSNTHYILTENTCITEKSPAKNVEIKLCKPNFFIASVNDPWHSISWHHGVAGDSVTISETGLYFYTGIDTNGCYSISQGTSVIVDPEENLHLNYSGYKGICYDDELVLHIPGFSNIQWSDGIIGEELVVNQPGSYFGRWQGTCKEIVSDTLHLEIAVSLGLPDIPSDTTVISRNFTYKPVQQNTLWFEKAEDGIDRAVGKNEIQFIMNRDTQTFWACLFHQFSYPAFKGGLSTVEYKRGAYNADFVNGEMLFVVLKDMVIDSVTVVTDFSGKRKIQILDPEDNLIFEKEYEIDSGRVALNIGKEIVARYGYFTIRCDVETNRSTFGTIGPKLQRSDKGFYFPIYWKDLGAIVNSNLGEEYYYYFYDWVVREADTYCVGEKMAIQVKVDPTSSDEKYVKPVTWMYSNALQELRLDIPNLQKLILLEVSGKICGTYKSPVGLDRINVSHLNSGLYIAVAIDNYDKKYPFRFIKI